MPAEPFFAAFFAAEILTPPWIFLSSGNNGIALRAPLGTGDDVEYIFPLFVHMYVCFVGVRGIEPPPPKETRP